MKYNKETLLRRFDAHMHDIRTTAQRFFELIIDIDDIRDIVDPDDIRDDKKREYIKQLFEQQSIIRNEINKNPEKLIELRNELKEEGRQRLIALAFLPDVEITVKDE